ncbi:hypothetical protein CMV_008254 [Castanea mollissima]|uniref:Uncharacterized protein n=1 Tax=Castanea mollissima TaxID=60419 RepID=A0A8J4VPH3_9ROSI|nr:hypothetical protein CMV_008254 [Castanea mollissima]
MSVTRRTPRQRMEMRNKPTRTSGITPRHAELKPSQTEKAIMTLPSHDVEPTGMLPHTDHSNQSTSTPLNPDTRNHVHQQNRFSHLADLADDDLSSAREENTALTHPTPLDSTSDATATNLSSHHHCCPASADLISHRRSRPEPMLAQPSPISPKTSSRCPLQGEWQEQEMEAMEEFFKGFRVLMERFQRKPQSSF